MIGRFLWVAAAMTTAAAGPPLPAPRPSPAEPLAGEAVTARAEAAGFPAGLAVGALGAIAVKADHPLWGGLSGIEVSEDGARFVAVSDRGALFAGRLEREEGRLAGVADLRAWPITDAFGRPRPPGEDDAEGLALGPDGALHLSFEGDEPRVWRLPEPGGRSTPVPPSRAFAALQRNSGLEALAIDADGAIYAIPERSGALDRPFPVFRRRHGDAEWTPGAWPRLPPHLVVGADVGPDGRLYVLERDFGLFSGFAVRVRRAPLDQWPDFRPETVFEARGLDNLEGISAWRDAAGRLRLLMVADDNFSPLQRTLLVEIAVD